MAREKRTSGLEAISKRISAYAVHVDDIVFQEGFLMRDEINRDQVESLKKQIIEYVIETKTQHPKPYGVHTPITGFYQDGKLALNHGHHRVSAVREMLHDGTLDKLVKNGTLTQEDVDRIVNIPTTRVAPPIGKDEASTKRAEALLYLRQITDNSGRNYSPLECARTCQLVESKYGLSQQEIAAILGKSVSQISNWLKLMDMPEEIQENISEGNIAATLVNDLVREHGETKAVELINNAVKKAKVNGNGKPKVTKKDVEEDLNITKLTKRQIKEIIEKLDYRALEDGRITVDADQFKAILGFFE